MPEDRGQKSEARNGSLGLDLLPAFQQREAGLDVATEAALASGFCHLASATHHRLHIPFPIDTEARNRF
jgi:hypothetical protein